MITPIQSKLTKLHDRYEIVIGPENGPRHHVPFYFGHNDDALEQCEALASARSFLSGVQVALSVFADLPDSIRALTEEIAREEAAVLQPWAKAG